MPTNPIEVINLRPGAKTEIKVGHNQTYQVIADSEADKKRVIFVLNYNLHGYSHFKVENTNNTPVRIEVYGERT